MRTFNLVVILCSLLYTAMGQVGHPEKFELLNEKQDWSEGSIMLSDGKELKGLVKYNDREGILSYQDAENKRVFTSKNVTGFEFFDESLQKQRVFYSFPYEDSQTSIKRPLFFEVIREYKAFAILSRADPIEIYQKQSLYGSPGAYNPVYNPSSAAYFRTEISQLETIFIMDSKGQLKPYVEVVTKEDGVKSANTQKDKKSKGRILDEDLLAEYVTQPVYEELKKYAKENDLKFKRKGDFIKILEYYDTIEKAK